MSELLWMVCTMCRQTVIQNDVGICQHCQGKYDRHNQPDSWDNMHRCVRCGQRLSVSDGDCDICDDGEVRDLLQAGDLDGGD